MSGNELDRFDGPVRLWGQLKSPCCSVGGGVGRLVASSSLLRPSTSAVQLAEPTTSGGTDGDTVGQLADVHSNRGSGRVAGANVWGDGRTAAAAVRLLQPPIVVMRAPHEQKTRKLVEEDETDPSGHPMGARGLKVPVDDDDCDENGEDVHDEGEKQVLGYQRNSK